MIRYFIHHPTAATLLMVLLLVLGLLATHQLQRETFPAFDSSRVQVRIVYPGAAPEDIEQAICLPLENALEGINYLKSLTCDARESLALVVAEMSDSGHLPTFIDDVQTAVDGITTFPDLIEPPAIRQLDRRDRVVDLVIRGPMAPLDLMQYAQQTKQQLQQAIPSVQVSVNGFSQWQWQIHVSEWMLQRYGLTIQSLAQRLRDQNLDLPIGTIVTQDQQAILRFDDRQRTLQGLQNIVVLSDDQGGVVRLGDMATFTVGFQDPERQQQLDGQRSATLSIAKSASQDTLQVMEQVDRFVAQHQADLPAGVVWVLTNNISTLVSDRLSLLVRNGLQGLALVFIVMWIFFRGRFAFWVAAGLPVAFLGGTVLLWLFGYTINMITMVGLLIALGLVMDDAIVLAENVAARWQRGEGAYQAAELGVKRVAPGVLASFLTTLAVFLPLLTLEGAIGKVMRVMPAALIFVLIVSLIEAFLILPNHMAHALHRPAKPSRWRNRLEQGLDRCRDGITWLIGHLVVWRYLFLGCVIGLWLVSMAWVVTGQLAFQGFPQLEGDRMEARLVMPQGTSLARTQQAVKQLINALQQVADQQRQATGLDVIDHIQVLYSQNNDVGESGSHLATVQVTLLTVDQRQGLRVAELLAQWRKATGGIVDAQSVRFAEPMIGPGGVPIQIRLQGQEASLSQLKAAAHAIQQRLARYQGVINSKDNLRYGKMEWRMTLKDNALSLGLTARDVASQLRGLGYGVTIDEFVQGNQTLEVITKGSDPKTLQQLTYWPLRTPTGQTVLLSDVVAIDQQRDFARILRQDGQRSVTISADLLPGFTAGAILKPLQRDFLPQWQQQYPLIQWVLEGESEETAETGRSLLISFLIGLFMIYGVLSVQFGSYRQPLVVMCLIPLAFIGVVWGHVLMGLSLSMPSLIGFVSLSGIVVNDAILLVGVIRQELPQQGVLGAVMAASRSRFRAVLLTSLTTIAGLLPLMLETSLQAQVLIPLVVSIVFGLLATTVLVLLVVPVLYCVVADWRRLV